MDGGNLRHSAGPSRWQLVQVAIRNADGNPVLIKLLELTMIDDGSGKPVNIQLHIGQRPIFAFGNPER